MRTGIPGPDGSGNDGVSVAAAIAIAVAVTGVAEACPDVLELVA